MRRTLFYLMIAIAAFGIGSFVVFKFYFQPNNVSSQNEVIENSKVETIGESDLTKKIKEKKRQEIELKNLLCDDERFKLVWKELDDEVDFVTSEEANEIKDCRYYFEYAKFTDLNSDNQNEIIIASCKGPFVGSGGCSFWIFQKSDDDYKKIFELFGGLKVGSTKTKGYRDLLTSFRYGGSEYSSTIYKFNGKKYVPSLCQMEHYTYKDKSGKIVTSKKPRITRYKCKETE